jgi:thioredoxin reductase (NADPH)
MFEIKNVVIIGSGPAGYTAAIYTARAMLKPLLITGNMKGGQLITTSDIENFPGYVNGIEGPKMMEELHQQAERFGTEYLDNEMVISVETSEKPFKIKTTNKEILTHSIIIATGASSIWLNAENESFLRSNGISTCATCDGAFFKGEDLIVVGGGDSAMEEAIFLTRYANKVTIVHRREEFRASKIMLERAKSNSKIEFKTNFNVKKWLVNEQKELIGALVENSKIVDETETIDCTGAFIAIGHNPNTNFIKDQIETNKNGYIINKNNSMMTSVSGIFSCGDVCESSQSYKQAITAAGEGCRAAMDCEKWLEEKNV